MSLAAVAMVAIAGFFMWRATRRSIIQEVLTPHEQQIDITALVTQVRELNRLETASMRVIHVSTITQTYDLVPDSLGGDKLTFLATGDVIAGFDLSQMKPGDAWREQDGTVALRLPPPQILVSRIDNKQSRVLTRNTGMLRRSDINLESRARQYAEQGVREEALKKGILEMASQNGEKKLAEFLHTIGVQKVRFIEIAAPPQHGSSRHPERSAGSRNATASAQDDVSAFRSTRVFAIPIASRSAADFRSVSTYSMAGSESYTMPAPACT
jgi:hypothetical protein